MGGEWSGVEGKARWGRGFSRYYDLCVKSEEKLLWEWTGGGVLGIREYLVLFYGLIEGIEGGGRGRTD